MSERAGEIALPEARGPGEDDGLVRGHPARGAEVDEERLGKPARMAVVDVFDARGEFQLGGFQAGRELAVFPGDPFRVGEEADEVRRRERLRGRVCLPLAERGDHPVELHGGEFLERLFDEHGPVSFLLAW